MSLRALLPNELTAYTNRESAQPTGRRRGSIERRSLSAAATSRAIWGSIPSWSASTKGTTSITAARVRAGFVPPARLAVLGAIKGLKAAKCPFVNLPEKKPDVGARVYGGQDERGVWVRPEAVAQVEFLEWTDANHLRHTKFVGLRDDKDHPRWCGRLEGYRDGALRRTARG